MYVCHEDDGGLANVVCELYQDEAAYQRHVKSKHFQRFAQLASKSVLAREVIELTPELLLKKPALMKVSGANNLAIRLAEIEIVPQGVATFQNSVFFEMKQAMAKEAGVLAMYAGSVRENPNHWYFFEVYQDQASYDSHCQTKHFKDYISATKDLVLTKKLTSLVTDTAVSQAGEI